MDKFQNKYRIPSARLQTWDYGWNAAYFITICTANREHYFGEIVNEPIGAVDLNIGVDANVNTDAETNVGTRCIASLQQKSPQPRLRPTEIVKIVETEWLKTPSLRPDMNLELDEFVVMPNHFHAILVIGKNEYNQIDRGNFDDQRDGDDQRGGGEQRGGGRDAMHRVSTSSSPQSSSPQSSSPQSSSPQSSSPQSSSPQSLLSPPSPSVATNDLPHRNQFGPQRKNLASIMRGFKSAVTKDAHAINPAFGWQERFHDHIIRDDAEFQRIAHYITNNPANWKDDKFYTEDGYNG